MVKVKDIMTPNPVTCLETDSVYEAVRLMKSEDIGVVPIVDQSGVGRGIVTDRDICLHIILENRDPKTTQLKEIMSRDLLTCKADDDISQALQQMERRQVKRILVVDQSNKAIGIISEHDIVKSVSEKEIGELAKGIYA